MRALLVAIIDDDKIYHSALKFILSSFSPASKTLNFMNGKEGYELLVQNTINEHSLPDCIFLDIEMPVMNGLTFLDKYNNLRNSLKKDIHVFVISSSLTEKNKQIIYNYPFVKRCIPKPFKSKEIEELLIDLV